VVIKPGDHASGPKPLRVDRLQGNDTDGHAETARACRRSSRGLSESCAIQFSKSVMNPDLFPAEKADGESSLELVGSQTSISAGLFPAASPICVVPGAPVNPSCETDKGLKRRRLGPLETGFPRRPEGRPLSPPGERRGPCASQASRRRETAGSGDGSGRTPEPDRCSPPLDPPLARPRSPTWPGPSGPGDP
jgi:hypothetical protein